MTLKIIATGKLANARRWNNHLKLWRASDLTQAEYCRLNGLRDKSFHYWLRKDRSNNAQHLQLVPVQITSELVLQKQSRQETSGLFVKFSNSARLEITRDFDPATFAQIVRVLADL